MNSGLKKFKLGIVIFRWLVKGGCIGIFSLLLAIFIGEGPPNLLELTTRQWILMVFFLSIWVGLVLALRWQLVAGVVILAGIVGFTIVGGLQYNWIFYTFWAVGFLNIFCWFLDKIAEKLRRKA